MSAPRLALQTPLAGRRAIVTGGASGIGRAVAERMAADGATVVIVDRDEAAAKDAASALGGEALVVDLSDGEAISALSGSAALRADILVNNAGIQHVAALEDFDPGRFVFIQRLMVEAPFRLTQAVLPSMYERGWGRIIHMSSVHGHRASAFKAAYVTAKHALEGLSKVIALEGAARGVTSNTVAPGYVRTALVEGQIDAQAQAHGISRDQVVDDVMLTRTAVQRMAEPSEIANAVALLCGPGSDSITGTSIVIDGGWSAS